MSDLAALMVQWIGHPILGLTVRAPFTTYPPPRPPLAPLLSPLMAPTALLHQRLAQCQVLHPVVTKCNFQNLINHVPCSMMDLK